MSLVAILWFRNKHISHIENQSSYLHDMSASFLTAHDAIGHVHLIIGANPLAGARCSKSIEVGAKPIVIAPADTQVHYTLQKKIDEGAVEWVQRGFEDEDLKSLGRKEVESIVDAVFVTLNGKHPISTDPKHPRLETQYLTITLRCTYFYAMPATKNSSQRY